MSTPTTNKYNMHYCIYIYISGVLIKPRLVYNSIVTAGLLVPS